MLYVTAVLARSCTALPADLVLLLVLQVLFTFVVHLAHLLKLVVLTDSLLRHQVLGGLLGFLQLFLDSHFLPHSSFHDL